MCLLHFRISGRDEEVFEVRGAKKPIDCPRGESLRGCPYLARPQSWRALDPQILYGHIGVSNESHSEHGTSDGEALLETQTCPNCGRAFVGDYCPDCGQEVNRELSILDVFSGFFREIIDIENGLWATLRGLTLRPGTVLRRYLNGARQRLMHPGRYLLASVVTSYAVFWGLGRAGMLAFFGRGDSRGANGEPDHVRAAFQQLFQYQEAQVVSTLVLAGLLALTLGRLFSDRVRRGAKALALSSFLTGYATFLAAGATLVLAPVEYLATGHPVEPSWYLSPLIVVPYVWGAIYWTFGGGVWVGVKAMLALGWTAAEYMVISTLAFSGWALWIVWNGSTGAPNVNIPVEGLVVTGGLALGLLLLHLGGELVARRW